MELDFVKWLTQSFAPPDSSRVRVGIGDDAAVLDIGADFECVVTSDMIMDGTHFELGKHDPQRVGRKALAVNLSDVAAMASEPLAAFVSLALPQSLAATLGPALLEGMRPLAEAFGVTIAGGDTNCWTGTTVISVTLVARCETGQALRRTGARPGDRLVVTGELGGSLLGKHLDFVPRVREALTLRRNYVLHAGCDISDGLSLDLWRLLEASQVGAVVRAERVPISDAARRRAAVTGQSPLRHALSDGEDFELLLAVPAATAEALVREQPLEVPLHEIGVVTETRGLWIESHEGVRAPLEPAGYRHGGECST